MAFNREKGSPALWRHSPSHGSLGPCMSHEKIYSNLNEENPVEVGKKKRKENPVEKRQR